VNAAISWWFKPAPAERLAALRIFIGGYALFYVWTRSPEITMRAHEPASHFAPVGVARLLSTPLPPAVTVAILIATGVLLVGFVLGVAWRVVAPLAALGLLWTVSYKNSWHMMFHTENLMVLHAIALACTPAADAWAIGAGKRVKSALGYGWGVKLLAALTAATYLLAGIAKLRLAGADWLDGGQLRNQIAVDNLRKAVMGDSTAMFALPIIRQQTLLAVLSVMTLVVELGAPLALIGGRPAKLWCLAAWSFHVGVVFTMNIFFPYPLTGAAFVPMLPLERVISVPREWWRRRSGSSP
jgi:hypothetical protein